MKCNICNSSEFKYCFTKDSIKRTVYREYCVKCGAFVGAMVKKEIALNCGYELIEQTGKAIDFKADVFKEKFFKLSDEHYPHSIDGLAFGFRKLDGGRKSYLLYFPKCKDNLGYINESVIEWIEQSWNETFLILLDTAIDLTPYDTPSFSHKIPQILLEEYNEYIKSPKWQRKRQARMALDNNECKLCFTRSNLRVHHISYQQLGDESMNHLLTVCRECHTLIHGHDTK